MSTRAIAAAKQRTYGAYSSPAISVINASSSAAQPSNPSSAYLKAARMMLQALNQLRMSENWTEQPLQRQRFSSPS